MSIAAKPVGGRHRLLVLLLLKDRSRIRWFPCSRFLGVYQTTFAESLSIQIFFLFG